MFDKNGSIGMEVSSSAGGDLPSFPRRNNKNGSNNDFLQLFVSHDDCLQFKTKFKSYTQTVSTRTLQDLRDFKDILVMIKVPAVIVRFLDFQRYKWLTVW